MKALSICQPWATLIVIGAKTFETRSWKTEYRGKLVIHASKTRVPLGMLLCDREPFKSALAAYGITDAVTQLPKGQIIGTVDLIDCHLAEHLEGAQGNIVDFGSSQCPLHSLITAWPLE